MEAYPFIDADALPMIRLVLDKVTRQGRTNPNERILIWKTHAQLSNILSRGCKVNAVLPIGKIVVDNEHMS